MPLSTLMQAAYRRRREAGLWIAYLALSNAVGATSVLIEFHRIGRQVGVWEPFVWEFSSGISTLVLLPLVLLLERRYPFTAERWRRHLGVHLLATVPFSLLHVGLMVGLRKLAYAFAGSFYDFGGGQLALELVYEWRKDLMTYGAILFIVNAYRVFRERAEGEANYVSPKESGAAVEEAVFRVTRRGRDTQLAHGAVHWIEAAGNYVILHTGEGNFMMRSTLKALEARLEGAAFLRVHRSAIVNLDQVAHWRSDAGGGGVLELRSGERIAVSRRLSAQLREALPAMSGSA
ncbi:MAG: LytTR family DNA-binding domain-containing protein [Pseudomonadota bacterium]